jgi:hypothetical protein
VQALIGALACYAFDRSVATGAGTKGILKGCWRIIATNPLVHPLDRFVRGHHLYSITDSGAAARLLADFTIEYSYSERHLLGAVREYGRRATASLVSTGTQRYPDGPHVATALPREPFYAHERHDDDAGSLSQGVAAINAKLDTLILRHSETRARQEAFFLRADSARLSAFGSTRDVLHARLIELPGRHRGGDAWTAVASSLFDASNRGASIAEQPDDDSNMFPLDVYPESQ